jgi:hypothetical protein
VLGVEFEHLGKLNFWEKREVLAQEQNEKTTPQVTQNGDSDPQAV